MAAARRSRRSFIQFVGLNGFAAAAGACATTRSAPGQRVGPRLTAAHRSVREALVRLDSNENARGPGPRVLAAIQDAFTEVNRYPFGTSRELTSAIAQYAGVGPDQIEVTCGSSEILDGAVAAFTAPDRALITAAPTFEMPANRTEQLGRPVIEVPVTQTLALDLEQMAAQSVGAGLVYVCNPNNPTAALHGGTAMERFVEDVLRREPKVTILIDEAYHEYVERSDYRTAIPLAVANPRVVVSRTFSKIFGLAGIRVGYAVGQRSTLAALTPRLNPLRFSCLSMTAALTALTDQSHIAEERSANHEARAFTARVFADAGYAPVASEANFLMVNVRRDIRGFQAACRERGISIARPFPPLISYARVTIGTIDEMTRAAAVFKEVLAQPPTSVRIEPVRRGWPRRDARDWAC